MRFPLGVNSHLAFEFRLGGANFMLRGYAFPRASCRTMFLRAIFSPTLCGPLTRVDLLHVARLYLGPNDASDVV